MHFELAENMHSYPCVDIWSCSRWDVIRVDQTRCIVRHSRKGVASDSSMGIAGIGVIGICSTQLQGAHILRCTLGCPLFRWNAGSSQELRGSMASFGHARKKYMWAALVRFPPRSAIDRDTAYILQTANWVPWWQLVRSALNIASKILSRPCIDTCKISTCAKFLLFSEPQMAVAASCIFERRRSS